MPTRRDFLKTAGATVATIATAGVASADHREPYEEQPEYVDLVYDKDRLQQYRPRLVTSHLKYQPDALYSWIATSTERDTEMYCYWAYYFAQEGFTSEDSHQYDREPVFVEVKDSGEIRSVHVDGYHYIDKQYWSLPMDGTHPLLHVQKPHHFYYTTDELGELVEVESFHDKYQAWEDNGWPASAEVVTNPWRVKAKGHYWDEQATSRANYWFYNAMLDASQAAGFDYKGSQEADL